MTTRTEITPPEGTPRSAASDRLSGARSSAGITWRRTPRRSWWAGRSTSCRVAAVAVLLLSGPARAGAEPHQVPSTTSAAGGTTGHGVAAGPAPLVASRLVLGRPVACLSRCRVAKLVDLDPRPEQVRDALGGVRATDRHAGIDIAVDSLEAGRRVLVLAMAPGRVLAVRDGMPDRDAAGEPRWWLGGRQGGNLVVVDHGGGLVTAYAHLARGSVAVRSGEQVLAGQVIGRPGMSGYAAFPHVEVRVTLHGRVVDPIAGRMLSVADLQGGPGS